MKKTGILAVAAALVIAVDSMAPLTAEAASVTDLQQQAENLINESLNKALEGEESASGSTDSGTASTDSGTSSSGSSEEEANEVDTGTGTSDHYETVEINSKSDFDKVVKNCHTDTWSYDKKIVLNTDLDFKKKEFTPIQSFGGIFDGNGHTLKGVRIADEADDTGVFGTIRSSGKVMNLKVKGTISPSNTQSKLGGIAGSNYGEIENCSFSGSISADRRVGGIVGHNGRNGTVTRCSASGSLTGKAACGGIVGYNEGTVNGCRNEMKVNTTYRDTTVTLDELTSTVDNALQSGDLLNSDNLEVNGDTGGIVGFSSGVITSCTNNGEVGYEHVGYNIGGIVGRTSGFLQNNINNGIVYGRKDTGGIAGQMQPYLAVDFAKDKLEDLDGQLDELYSLVNTALSQADDDSSKLQTHLKNLNTLADTARNAAKTITDEAEKDVNDAASKVNNATGTIQNSLTTFSNIAAELQNFLTDVQNAANGLSDSFTSYVDSLQISDDDKASLDEDWDTFQNAVNSLSDGLQTLSDDLKAAEPQAELDLAKIRQDFQTVQNAFRNITGAITRIHDRLSSAVENGRAFLSSLYQRVQQAKEILNGKIFQKVQDTIDRIRDRIGKRSVQAADISSLRDSVDSMQNSLKEQMDPEQDENEIQEALVGAGVPEQNRDAIMNSWDQFPDAFQEVTDAMDADEWGDPDDPSELKKAVDRLTDALESEVAAVQSVLSSMDTVRSYLDKAQDTDDVRSSIDALKDVLDKYPKITDELTGAFDSLASMDLQMNGVSSTLRTSGNNLYESLGQIQSEMDTLNSDLSSGSDQGIGNLRSISTQVNTIAKTIQDAADDLQNPGSNRSVEDISDENIQDVYQGRITECANNGEVQADTNVGGIAGILGLEYNLDPDADIQTSGNTSLDYIFRMRCILDSCTNNGLVAARGSYSGGIAGQMEMGLVAQSRNFGNLDSESNYVGGIAGYTTGLVRNSTAKCDLSGKKYIGGITGYGVDLHDNYAMVDVLDSDQYVGAIAGKVKNVNAGDVYQNYYYAADIYGIDSVSYAGIAEGKSYDELTEKFLADGTTVGDGEKSVSGNRFTQLVLTFKTDDAVVKTLTVSYGDSVPEEELPKVPSKEGFHGEWSRTDYSHIISDETITAEYSRINTLLTSKKTRKGGLSVLEAVGRFHQDDELKMTDLKTQGGETERWKVTIPNDGETSHEMRYLPADDSAEVTVYVVEDGRRTRVKTSEFGKYRTFTVETKDAGTDGSDVIIAVREVSEEAQILRNVIIIAAVAAAAVFLLLRFIRKKRRKS